MFSLSGIKQVYVKFSKIVVVQELYIEYFLLQKDEPIILGQRPPLQQTQHSL